MALFSPAYIGLNVPVLTGIQPVFHVNSLNDDEKTFLLHYAIPFSIDVLAAQADAPFSHLALIQAAFTGIYFLKIYNVIIYIDGYVLISQNGITTRAPLDINSNILSVDLVNTLSISKTPFPGNFQVNSLVNTLETLYLANENTVRDYINYAVIKPFYNPAANAAPVSLPLRKQLTFPLSHGYNITQPDNYINLLFGIGMPAQIFNQDCSHTGNGMLDYEFSVVDNPYHATNFGSYGSRYVFRDLPTDDLSAKIVSMNLIYNVFVNGEILK